HSTYTLSLHDALPILIRIDSDAVAADQPRLEAEEVPLGARRIEHVPHRDSDPREDLGDLIDECDVDVALGILDRLRRLRRLDRGDRKSTRLNSSHDQI